MNRESIARVAHEVNRAYCASLGDVSVPAWEDAEQAQRDSILAGVDMHLADPDTSPEDSHAAWLAAKEAAGWIYAEVKDVAAKQHPCIVPYDELPAEQKAKDYLFRAVVHALKAIPDAAAPAVLSAFPPAAHLAAKTAAPMGAVTIAYIGRRPDFVDRLYGSGLSFVQGQTRTLPPTLASKFLRHPDMFERCTDAQPTEKAASESPTDDTDDTAEQLAEAERQRQEQEKQLDQIQGLRDQVAHMDKDALKEFAMVNYRQPVNKSFGVEKIRQQVLGYIDQFGAV